MPLAVTLMAKLGKGAGVTAEQLLEEYCDTGTTMLGRGSDAQHSMDISISLSVDSPPMRVCPEAYELLTILAMLPMGSTRAALGKWWAHKVSNRTSTIQVLREASLVEFREPDCVFVLPVIRTSAFKVQPVSLSLKLHAIFFSRTSLCLGMNCSGATVTCSKKRKGTCRRFFLR